MTKCTNAVILAAEAGKPFGRGTHASQTEVDSLSLTAKPSSGVRSVCCGNPASARSSLCVDTWVNITRGSGRSFSGLETIRNEQVRRFRKHVFPLLRQGQRSRHRFCCWNRTWSMRSEGFKFTSSI